MGNWNINIQGIGCHHNAPDYEGDAEKMAAAFVRALKNAGHQIESAAFTFGAKNDLAGDVILGPERTNSLSCPRCGCNRG